MTRAAPARGWQRMLSGRRLDILDPSPLDIELEDIAHGLARVARWNGQTRGDHVFSVAQHSLLVEAIAGELDPGLTADDRLAILLHDAPEYVVGDVVTPLKAAIGEPFRAIEARLLSAILVRFGLPPAMAEGLRRIVKRADRAAAFLEATSLAGFSRVEAGPLFGPPRAPSATCLALLDPLPAGEAARFFQDRVAAVRTGSGARALPGSPGRGISPP